MENKDDEKVLCRTPTAGKAPTRIPKWKYETLEAAILASVPQEEPGISFKKLPEMVHQQLSEDIRNRLGSVSWHTTTVKLEMEVRGKIKRIKGITPQHLIRCE